MEGSMMPQVRLQGGMSQPGVRRRGEAKGKHVGQSQEHVRTVKMGEGRALCRTEEQPSGAPAPQLLVSLVLERAQPWVYFKSFPGDFNV